MPRPPKSVSVIQMERKSHRTKAELNKRRSGEEQLLTGERMKEKRYIRSNADAHREFRRLQKYLGIIGKNDALQENVINRYCQIYAECIQFEASRDNFFATLGALEDSHKQSIADGGMTWLEYLKLKTSIQGQIIALDKQIQAKRDMLLKIEKENLMTIAAALRAVPKQVKEEEDVYKGMFG